MNVKSGCDIRKSPDTKFNQTSGKVSWEDCPTIDYRIQKREVSGIINQKERYGYGKYNYYE